MAAGEAPARPHEQVLRAVPEGQAPPPPHRLLRAGAGLVRAQPAATEPGHDGRPAGHPRALVRGVREAGREAAHVRRVRLRANPAESCRLKKDWIANI